MKRCCALLTCVLLPSAASALDFSADEVTAGRPVRHIWVQGDRICLSSTPGRYEMHDYARRICWIWLRPKKIYGAYREPESTGYEWLIGRGRPLGSEWKRSGEETVDGQPCTVYSVGRERIWIARANGLALRRLERGKETRMTHIHLGAPSADHFRVPHGYKRVPYGEG